MKILLTVVVLFLSLQCARTSKEYEKCEKADETYLLCSLGVYQNYAYCTESAGSVSGSASDKASAKFNCDSARIIGLYVCEKNKIDVCGTK